MIIEDEQHAGERLQQLLIGLDQRAEVLSILESVKEAVQWFQTNTPPDLMFLDIHLADGSSFEIFNEVTIDCPVVFTTAYDQYALKAFEVNSVDYLLKPIDKDDLSRALKKFEKQYARKDRFDYSALTQLINRPTENYKQRFLVNKGSSLVPVSTSEIAYIHTDNGLVYLKTLSNVRYVLNYKLEELEQMLDPKTFFRANRQFITSSASILKVHPFFNGKLKIEVQPSFPSDIVVSRLKATDFKAWLGE